MSEQPQEFQTPQEPETSNAQPETQPQVPPTRTRRRFLRIGGGVFIILVLAGAAYLAGSYMNRNANNPNGTGSGVVLSQGGGPVIQKKITHLTQVTPAPELPAIQPDVRGVFLSRSGNTFTIGSGGVQIGVQANSAGQSSTPQVNFDGPTYEVVLTQNTVIYKDTTSIEPGQTGPIQQTVAPGSPDDFNRLTLISVWGKKTGDRFIADVIVYMEPPTQVKGGSGGTLK